MKEIKLKHNLK